MCSTHDFSSLVTCDLRDNWNVSSSVLQFDSNLIGGLGAKWLVVLKVIQETQWSLPKEQQGCQNANWDT